MGLEAEAVDIQRNALGHALGPRGELKAGQKLHRRQGGRKDARARESGQQRRKPGDASATPASARQASRSG